jgi:hypothetical protein
MGLWAKSVVIFKAIREHGQQSIRSLADRTGLSKSSVHRHLQAMDRRDRYPESSLWETEAGRTWLIRLVVATLFVFGLKRGVGAETLSAFFGHLRPEGRVGCSPSALRCVMHTSGMGVALLSPEPSCPLWTNQAICTHTGRGHNAAIETS